MLPQLGAFAEGRLWLPEWTSELVTRICVVWDLEKPLVHPAPRSHRLSRSLEEVAASSPARASLFCRLLHWGAGCFSSASCCLFKGTDSNPFFKFQLSLTSGSLSSSLHLCSVLSLYWLKCPLYHCLQICHLLFTKLKYWMSSVISPCTFLQTSHLNGTCHWVCILTVVIYSLSPNYNLNSIKTHTLCFLAIRPPAPTVQMSNIHIWASINKYKFQEAHLAVHLMQSLPQLEVQVEHPCLQLMKPGKRREACSHDTYRGYMGSMGSNRH